MSEKCVIGLLYYLPMERMKKRIGKRKVEVHKMEGLYPYVRLEDFMFVVKQLEEENKKLRAYADNLDSENDNQAMGIEELRKENISLHLEIEDLKEKYGDLDY